jgi:hypothetical protein
MTGTPETLLAILGEKQQILHTFARVLKPALAEQ